MERRKIKDKMTLRTKEHKEAYDLEEKPWKEEKPLSEKIHNVNMSIGFDDDIKGVFIKKDVAQAVERLKEDIDELKREELGRTTVKLLIDRRFGDLK